MKYTNKFGIDEPIAEAIKTNAFYDQHDADISVSQLVKPPRATALELLHDDEIEKDVSDGLWMLLGSAVHAVIAEGGSDDIVLQEERLFVEVNGWRVSGKPDVLRTDDRLTDYKVTSVWSFLLSDKADWEMQLNFYAELLRRNGFEVSGLRVSAILRDWQASKKFDHNYPEIPFMAVAIPLWPEARAEHVLNMRVQAHQAARAGQLPECTEEERWTQAASWAVMKHGQIRATRVLPSEEQAELFIISKGSPSSLYIQHRPGKNSRCEGYCDAAPWCEQFQALKGDEDEPLD